MYPVYFFVLAIVFGGVQLFFFNTPAVEAFLLGLIVCNIGLQGIYAFLGHYFKADEVAEGIGWPAGNPFQTEIAFANLGRGVLGILSIWFHGEFWLATIISTSVFLWGAGYIHIKELREQENTCVFNAGPVLYFDILLPVLWFALYAASVF